MQKLANFLLLFPVISTLYIYAPIMRVELDYRLQAQASSFDPKSFEYGIVIPKLGVNETIIPNVDPFNKTEYMDALYQGVAHAENTVTPDQKGTTYLFAHSSDNPFSITRYNTSFYLLPKLDSGDEIKVYYQGLEHTYRVSKKEIVKPYEIETLTKSTENQLILQTCTPIGTSVNRLLIFAEKVS